MMESACQSRFCCSLFALVSAGIEQFGIVEVEPGIKVYAYEVDGLGNKLVSRKGKESVS